MRLDDHIIYVDGEFKAQGNTFVGAMNDIEVTLNSKVSQFIMDQIYTDTMFIKTSTGNSFQKLTASGIAWSMNGNKMVYLDDGTFIGIGLSNPSVELEVSGTISTNYLVISDTFIVPEMNLTDSLGLYTLDSDGYRYSATDIFDLFVEDTDLYISGTYDLNLSNIVTIGSGDSGYLASFLNDTTLTSQNTNLNFEWDSSLIVRNFIGNIQQLLNDFIHRRLPKRVFSNIIGG